MSWFTRSNTSRALADRLVVGGVQPPRPAVLDQYAHHRIEFRQRQISCRHADGLHRAQATAGQRVGEIGRASVIIGDAAQRQRHGFTPA